jgi:hypothetical protein
MEVPSTSIDHRTAVFLLRRLVGRKPFAERAAVSRESHMTPLSLVDYFSSIGT